MSDTQAPETAPETSPGLSVQGEDGSSVTLDKNGLTEDDVLTAVLEAGAEEIDSLDDSFEIICEPGDLVGVRTALQDAGIDYESAEASFQPSVTVPVDLEGARKVVKLIVCAACL